MAIRPVQTLSYKQQGMPREPSNVGQVALACKLNRGMPAVIHQISAESTSNMAEKDFQSIKTEIDIMEIDIKEALQDCSLSARLKCISRTRCGRIGTDGGERQSAAILGK